MQHLLSDHLQQSDTRTRQVGFTSEIKVPKMALPIFNGNKAKWIEFWDSFRCAVSNNTRILDVEKFNYLKYKLVGKARKAVDGLAL